MRSVERQPVLNSPVPSRERCVSLVGCGWLGLPLAEKLMARGFHVRGSTTRPDKLSLLSSLGVEAHLLRIEPDDSGEWSTGSSVSRLFDSSVLVWTLPLQAAFGPDYYLSQLDTLLARRKEAGFDHLVFVSSTSVYGSKQGRVDESTSPDPDTDQGRILARAEEKLTRASHDLGFGLTIVRPGGLVGPGRHPGLFLAGRKGLKDPESPVNLLHQHDGAEAIAELVSLARPANGIAITYNLVANFHPARRDFYPWASAALGLEPPEFDTETSDSATKYVLADRIREHVTFRFDDIRASLHASESRR
jgi:nucleoside-diphosphate-sugar epimerase